MILCWVAIAGLVLVISAMVHYTKAKKNIHAGPDSFEGAGLSVGGLFCGIVGPLWSPSTMSYILHL